jgi:riboflavin kinase/FMN adenylyltransferase
MIGNFDGVHRGHQAVLRQGRTLADARGVSSLVLTFDPHPNEVLGRGAPSRLATLGRRVELLGRHGADDVVVEPFTNELAQKTPTEFAEELLSSRLGAKAVVVGRNFRFGKGRAGDLATLRTLGEKLGFEALAADVAGDTGGPFSSTRVREAIAQGDLVEATKVLGRPHAISGLVAHGDKIGRTIGFPTANIGAVFEAMPPRGVYAVTVDTIDGAPKALGLGVLNIGMRPTVGGTTLRVEVHLLDIERDLYGVHLRIHLVQRLRNEQKFTDTGLLRAQIAEDVRTARTALYRVGIKGQAYG